MAQDWDVKLYDNQHGFVTSYGEAVLDLLAPQPGERILDVGCGTGHLTHQIAERGAVPVGIDPSPAMIEAAQAAYPDLDFRPYDAADFSFPEPFDAIFSNAALHWVTDAENAARCMSNALKPGGRFVIEMGGKGNVQTILQTFFKGLELGGCRNYGHRWFFPSIGEYSSMLERYGLEVSTAWLFDRPTPLEGEDGYRNWITMFGEAIHAEIDSEGYQQAVKDGEERARSMMYREGTWFADYRRLRLIAVKR